MYKKISSLIRKKILEIAYIKKANHIGSNLSIVDILVVLYKDQIKKNNNNKLILSKGHACLSLYCILNYFKFLSSKNLDKYSDNNSVMMSHASHKVPGVFFSTGSLGHGLSYAAGKCYINKKDKIFVLLSDGELNEGSNWEALLFIAHHKLTNLIIIVDYNKLQGIDHVDKVIKLDPIDKKLKSFGFDVLSINGHKHLEIKKAIKKKHKKPLFIIANTIKGKGVDFMENKVLWHYKSLDLDLLGKALKQL
jgi:transketolase